MNDDCWDEVTVKKEGFDLNKFISDSLLSDLRDKFEGKTVNCINISFIIRDEKIEPDNNLDVNVVTIRNKSIEDTLTETVYLTSDSNIQELKKVFNKYDD
ncbi:hypothetical protein [Methanobrevibacter smithii]|uniref:hypothetical protein n=1 Tax=Methanobrevibacter smithii TaxID=2173 RepID=UPI0037DD7F57